ncbi:AAA family ATPase [Pseudonocardia spirodelae]|uniref:ATP-binding protein n=1 Tax=Pseudonocardia spirodelae TaxID=3133431 RepID=A0ABU8T2X6_9PSEU
MLLRFRVINHEALRDETELSLVRASLKTQTPPDGDWVGATNRVAAVYGPNASGKSTLLRAVSFLKQAVERPAAHGHSPGAAFPVQPYLLDAGSRSRPSLYEIDFVIDGVRHQYGFEVLLGRILEEYLYSYPSGKRRALFERGEVLEETSFGRGLRGPNAGLLATASPSTLLLSCAPLVGHADLLAIRDHLVEGLSLSEVARTGRAEQLAWLRHALVDDELRGRVEVLIRNADLGITGISLQREELGPREVERLVAAHERLATGPDPVSLSELLSDAEYTLQLQHASSDPRWPVSFPLSRESDGTVAWLAVVVPALHAFATGKTLLVDEVGANLHPVLTRELITIFKDPELNRTGGQLVLTTHDTALLGSLLGDALARDEVWFTEKQSDGASVLYSLDEFEIRSEINVQERYLEGRFGAVPQVRNGQIRSALFRSDGVGADTPA